MSDMNITLGTILANSRKAIVAGGTAVLSAGIPLLWSDLADGKIDGNEASLLLTLIPIFFAAAYAAYKVANRPLPLLADKTPAAGSVADISSLPAPVDATALAFSPETPVKGDPLVTETGPEHRAE